MHRKTKAARMVESVDTLSLHRKTKAARMVESVDTRDLKSLGYCSCVGSSPTPGTDKTIKLIALPYYRAVFLFHSPTPIIPTIVKKAINGV